ncbi:2-dehydro-3-deoxygalactonokinase [Shimia aestuarii]|uniref:2-keto-3-deoxygalactonate kinase n=1 Tax=Shimia aestuarii TaxID=254406 RepID=A0A1I4Q8S1_9RHOB|nr:2-dehydro-3-deoxygalactonokinase [Shimia aestuarii]SFM36459.1 2-keto-3-deoxygalactonate kinase [Shimia aestuarii]
MTAKESWIAVDIGASVMRAWQITGDRVPGAVRQVAAPDGYTDETFEGLLLELIGGWFESGPNCVLVSGLSRVQSAAQMVPFAAVPVKPATLKPVLVPVSDPRIRLFAVPGLRQARPVDVTQGDETRVAGFLARNPSWDGVICCVGRATTWAHVSADEVVSFQAFLTGELCEQLCKTEALGPLPSDGWGGDVFIDAMEATLSRPEALASRLHGLRAQKVLGQGEDAALSVKLAGYFLGAELGASRPYWLGQHVAVIGDTPLALGYEAALKRQGAPVEKMSDEEATIAGLRVAYQALMDLD